MRCKYDTFGEIRIDGVTYEHDVVIEGGRIRKRDKRPSKRLQGEYGHTPLSAEERIPWDCKRLVLGTGYSGALPVVDELRAEAKRRHVELVVKPTREAAKELEAAKGRTNAILHVTC